MVEVKLVTSIRQNRIGGLLEGEAEQVHRLPGQSFMISEVSSIHSGQEQVMGIKAFQKTAMCLLFCTGGAWATEPLSDQVWYQSRAGTLFMPGKGAIPLPASDQLRAMAIGERCSAMGGPRGVYRFMSGKLWLIGLHRCSGGIALRDIYPEMLTPPVASWVDGVVVARLGRILCMSSAGVPIPDNEVRFTVQKGVVVALEERVGDLRSCELKPPL
jgi:hypothetical protein